MACVKVFRSFYTDRDPLTVEVHGIRIGIWVGIGQRKWTIRVYLYRMKATANAKRTLLGRTILFCIDLLEAKSTKTYCFRVGCRSVHRLMLLDPWSVHCTSAIEFFQNSHLIRRNKKFRNLIRNWIQIAGLPVRHSIHYICACVRLKFNPIHAWVILSNSSNSSNWTKISSFWKKFEWCRTRDRFSFSFSGYVRLHIAQHFREFKTNMNYYWWIKTASLLTMVCVLFGCNGPFLLKIT